MNPLPMYTQEYQQTFLENRTDAILAKQILAGDQEAFEILVHRYHAPLFNFICRCLGDYDQACDVLQQVFLRFYTSLPKLEKGGAVKSWLFQVAHHCCVDELRRKERQVVHFSQLEKNKSELVGLYNLPDPGPLPEEVVERRDLQAQLQEAILTLPPRFRSIVILRYSSQMSFPEIGQVLSIPENTAKASFHRAKVLLRKTLLARFQMQTQDRDKTKMMI